MPGEKLNQYQFQTRAILASRKTKKEAVGAMVAVMGLFLAGYMYFLVMNV